MGAGTGTGISTSRKGEPYFSTTKAFTEHS